MILGNSKGQNTGKKYLMRKNFRQITPDQSQTARCSDFNAWYIENHNRLRLQIIDRGGYNEDVFTDTYIRICESLIFGNTEIKCYASYFSRAYYTNYILSMKNTHRACELPYNLAIVDDSCEESIALTMKEVLIKDVMDYVRKSFCLLDYLLFRMATSEGYTYKECSKLAGIPAHIVGNKIRNIREKVRQEFGKRRIDAGYKCTLSGKLEKTE